MRDTTSIYVTAAVHCAPMPSVFTHALVGAAVGLVAGARREMAVSSAAQVMDRGAQKKLNQRLVLGCTLAAVLPDADALLHGFFSDAHPLSHRGVSHAPAFYAACILVICQLPQFRNGRWRWGIALFATLLSHSVLDMFSQGSLGVALYWPFSDARIFFNTRLFPESPLSVAAFFSERGVEILRAELPYGLACLTLAWLVQRARIPAVASERTNRTMAQDETSASELDHVAKEDDIAVLEIEESIDLHSFAPRDILDVVEAYLEAAHERGYSEVRLIHGRGKGVQRARIRKLLETHPQVLSFKDAPHTRGGWGATLVWLKQN